MSMTNPVMIPNPNGREGLSIAVATNGICIPRATSGPVLDLDLIGMVEQLRHEAAWSDGRNSRTLVKHGDFRVVLTVMKTGARLHRHHSRGTVLIQVLGGHVRTRALDDVVDVHTGHALSLDPHLDHEVEAMEESALLVTIAWPHDVRSVDEEPAARLRRMSSLCSIADTIETAAAAESEAA